MTDIEILERQAVNAAINFEWDKAIELNNKIIEIDKKNANAYLRLGFAYLQSDNIQKAKKSYQKAIKFQPGSQIAKQNLERIQVLEVRGKKTAGKQNINLDPSLFIEVLGRTKSVSLVNVGQKETLAQLTVGQEVYLKPKKRRIEIRTKSGEYIGCLADDLSKRLILFLQAKSRYCAYIKEANLNKVIIFIKEEKKGKKVGRYISFPFNIKSNLGRISMGEETEVEEPEGELKSELETLAENLSDEEKIYLPYKSDDEEEEAEE